MLKDFKEFALKGSVLDMAFGIIIGVAFGKVISSFVADILMPPLGLVTGKMDFSNQFISLDGRHFESLKAAKDAGAATLNYWLFLNNVVDFTIVAFAIFLVVRQINAMRKLLDGPPPAPDTKTCPRCLSTVPLKASRCSQCTSDLAVN